MWSNVATDNTINAAEQGSTLTGTAQANSVVELTLGTGNVQQVTTDGTGHWSYTLQPGDIALIPCGFAMALPPGFEAQVRPRSGLATKFGISMPNAPGTVDADYRGEMKVPLINLGRQAFTVEPGMRVAQMIIARVARAEVAVVHELTETSRGAGGFGSTGFGQP